MSSNKETELVLVTGAGGFIALAVIDKFIREGYKVRGTVRSLSDAGKIASLRKIADESKLELVEADLLNADSWTNALKGVTIVMHVASPFPSDSPKDEMEVIRPAVDGTLNVLREAFNNRDTVKRVVVTSSTIAILGTGKRDARVYNENDWIDPEKSTYPYEKSKVLAEKAAWDFVDEKKKANEKCFELAVVNPTFVLGPTLHGQSVILGTSESLIKSYLEGAMQELPKLDLPICDVRDVADAHFIVAFSPDTVGHRHIIVSQSELVPMKAIADILYDEFSSKGFTNIPRNEAAEGEYSQVKLDNSRMVNVLGITPTPLKKSVIDAANSMIESGIVTAKA